MIVNVRTLQTATRKLGIAVLFTTSLLQAQPGRGPAPERLDSINPDAGYQVLEALRNARYDGDYIFKFELRHMPRRGQSTLYRGTLFGTWNDAGNQTRIDLDPRPLGVETTKNGEDRLRLLMQNGTNPWVVRLSESSKSIDQLNQESLYEPLIPGITITPFDLLMPFLYWENASYEGPKRIKGRPAHQFLLSPPADLVDVERGFEQVRIAVDEDYLALLRVDLLDENANVIKSYRILNFKKVSGEWIVKSIDLVDHITREKTRFHILSVAMGQDLDRSNFQAESLVEPLDYPSRVDFDSL